MELAIGHLCKTLAMTRVVIASISFLIWPFIFCKITYALPSKQVNALQENEICFSVKAVRGSTLRSNFTKKLEQAIPNDPVKVKALSHALSIACRSDSIDLTYTPTYRRLKELLRMGREEYESKGVISKEALRPLE